MFPNDEAILSFLDITQSFYNRERPNDSYNKERQKKIEETIENATIMVDRNTEHPGHWNILGSLYLEQKQYHEAIDCFLKAIEIAPTYKAFWNNLSIAYYQTGEKMKALECFKEGLLLEKEHGSIITDGPDYILQGKTLDEYLRNMDQYQKENIPALKLHWLFLLTTHYLGNRNSTLALKCLIRLVRFDSKNPELYYQISTCLWDLGEEERSINFLKKALEINPDDNCILDTLVTIYFKRKDFHKAKKYLQQILKINPEDTEIILDLAAAHAELKEKEETIFYLKKCLEIDSSYLPQIIMDPSFLPYLSDLEEIINNLRDL